jgi:hypothetical protein
VALCVFVGKKYGCSKGYRQRNAAHMDAAKDIDKEMLPIWAAFLCRYPLLLPYFLPTETHNTTLFYRGTCIQGRHHLLTAATSVQSCAYRSLCVTIKLDSAIT